MFLTMKQCYELILFSHTLHLLNHLHKSTDILPVGLD